MLKLSLLLLSILLTPASFAKPNTFLPVDEAARDPSFLAFRTELIRVVKEQDEQALLKIVDPQIEYSFGDDPGVDGFSRQWKLNNGGSHELWQSILAVLELGGKFNQEGEFVAPYVFANWPANRDGFEYSAVIVPEASVRAKANARAKPVAKVGYEILKLRDARAPEKWMAVDVNGKRGFLPSYTLRSPIDFRAFFKKVEGEWRMTAFIAGD
jgi:hypothetical protein